METMREGCCIRPGEAQEWRGQIFKKIEEIESVRLDDLLAQGSDGLGGVHFRWLLSF